MTITHRPSIGDRAMSTPLSINTLAAARDNARVAPVSRLAPSILTPPASPRHSRSSSDLSTKTDNSSADDHFHQHRRKPSNLSIENSSTDEATRTEDGTLICPFEVEVLKDQRNRNQIFGYGAWSTVFKGLCRRQQTSGLMTPPLSPASMPPLLVAVKQPARKDANKIIQNEAKVHSYLMTESGNEEFIVPFYGILTSTSALVLSAMPLSLEEHIKSSAVSARNSRTTWNMTQPVIGTSAVWLDLAAKLISALSWLHEIAGVVHGDIKPGNILLDRMDDDRDMELSENSNSFPYRPLLADFSSSQRMDGSITTNTLSALTREYAAPELLSSKVLSNPNSTATKASDVFSMAVTLLVTATGNTMVYSGSVYQRQAMATQGWMVIQSVRNGPLEEGARVPKQGVVERVLDQAVLREGMGRIDAVGWKSRIEDMMNGEPSKL